MIKKKRKYYAICREFLDGKYFLSNSERDTWVKREMSANEFCIRLFATKQKAREIMTVLPKWNKDEYDESFVEVTVEFNI